VGDRVRISRAGDEGNGAIDEVLPRTSKLARRGSGEDAREQVIAANISRVLIVAAIREPEFQASLVDRILAAAERQELPASIVLTKLDRDRKGNGARWAELYRSIGYEVFVTSVAPGHETEHELEALRELLHTNVTVLSGLSGVGKSSLLNALIPGLGLRIGSLGKIRQGKHTTTHTQLIPLPGGGYVLDTPGIRSFGLFATDPGELTFYFREMRALRDQCAFRNCSHRDEPDCAIVRAVENGEIAPSRWESYQKLYAELAKAEDV
ncbi:MAG: ribosome small subunit-dependent GTPase A, partial [Planctomycetes bacterium]|nr:ribosome small subunit-dependent GTPase A [Planctomycetota bacterium]